MQAVNRKQLDLEILPDEARKQIIDFYEFLLRKYSYKQRKDKSKLPEEFYKPIRKEKYLSVKNNTLTSHVSRQAV